MENSRYKFRAWDDCRKEMLTNHKWVELKCSDGKLSAQNYAYGGKVQQLEVMQYTGLTDKNGVEIFEGDLLRVCNNNNGVLEVVFRNEYVGGWVLTHPSTVNTASLGARAEDELEVVGNIHANPELLEGTS